MEAFAAILFGLLITFTCGDTLRRTIAKVRRGDRRHAWRSMAVSVLGLSVGLALLTAGLLST